MQSSTSRVWFVLALFSLSVLVSCDSGGGTPEPDEPSELGVDVTGTVTSAENDEPIGGVSVEVLRADNGNTLASATTDTTGSYEATFTIEEPSAPDQIRLELSAEGFVDKEVSTGFQPSVTEDVTLEAMSVEATASGTVTDSDTGDPIEGASVTGTRPDGGEQLFETTTSSDGSYEVTFEVADEPDEVAIQADAQGFEAADTTVSFSEQISADLGLQVATTQAIASGTVTNEDTGDPIEGASITGTRPDGGDQLFQATTSSDGTYEASFEVADEPSEIEISANADGFEMASQTVTFSGDISASFELPSATTQSTASGQVTREDNGDPIGGASVTGTRAGSGEKLFETTTASDGTYEATFGVTDEPSEVTVQAEAEDFESGEQTVNFGEQITADVSLQPATIEATASGTVSRSDSGDPIEVATVTGTRAGSGEQLFEATTSSDGSYQASYSVKATNEPSDVDFAVSAGDFTSGGATVAFAEEIARDFQLEPKTTEATVSGAVTRSDNSDPIDGATVTGSPAGGSGKLFETTTNASGEYETTFEVKVPDEPDQISVTANSGDYDGSEKTVDFGSAITTDFALDPSEVNVTIDGTITAKLDGSTVEGAEVSAFRPNGSGALASTTSEMGGAYSLSFTVLAPDAPDELRIEATEQRFSDATMTVGFSESIGQDIALSSIEISTIDELQAIQTDSDFPLDGYYKQTADIDASGFGSFQPIGDEIVPFSGTFDGKKFAISNLNIENEGEPNSFFRFISEDGVLKDVRLKGVKVNAASNGPAGLVGVNRGLIESIYLKGIIIGDLISVGGVVSKNYGVIKSVEANVTVEGAFDTGGLVSFNSGMIRDAHVTGEISGGNNIGGVVGRNGGSGTIMNSSSSVNISSNTDNMGGIAGESGGKIESCFSNSTLSGKSSVGGVVGLIEGGEVSNSYSIGSIDGNSEVGGLAGTNNDGEISKSFAAGDISGSSDVGGLTGVNGGTLSSTVWDTEASGQSSGVGRGDATGTTGLTTSEMQGNSAEENMDGFDFQNTWRVVMGDYPALQWEK